MAQFAKDRPFVAAAKFDMIAVALDDGSNAYGTAVGPGNGLWVLGSTLLGRRIEVTTINGALTGAPTGLKVGLMGPGDDANGTNGALISGTETEWATPAAGTKHACEIDLAKVTINPAKYYAIGAALSGGGTTALSLTTISRFLDPLQAS